MYSIEEFDEAKTKVLKYILYKKRTEYEIKTKFSRTISEELLIDVIEELKEIGYINDLEYIKRAVKEVKYKLMSKGIRTNLIEDYISDNYEEMIEYEIKSAQNIANKKHFEDENEKKAYLYKKGYSEDSISNIY